ncbi:MAG: lipoate--protein ligase family protein [Deltaproteobacteria bacterium]|nr:lipoate--protein ligase family protein [Deltaproteobacteria bacterium]
MIRDSLADGAYNMAVDEAIVTVGDITPTLRLYGWLRPTISVGYMQQPGEQLLSARLPIVRRITGGRAVLHHRAELTYSVICSEKDELFSMGISGAYALISKAILAALKGCGVQAELKASAPIRSGRTEKDSCFHVGARSEVMVSGRKLVGSAQRRFKASMLQHGSIIFEVDEPLMDKAFGSGAHRDVATISEFSDITIDAFGDNLVQEMGKAIGTSFEAGVLTEAEVVLKDALLAEKYLKKNLGAGQVNIAAEEVVNG